MPVHHPSRPATPECGAVKSARRRYGRVIVVSASLLVAALAVAGGVAPRAFDRLAGGVLTAITPAAHDGMATWRRAVEGTVAAVSSQVPGAVPTPAAANDRPFLSMPFATRRGVETSPGSITPVVGVPAPATGSPRMLAPAAAMTPLACANVPALHVRQQSSGVALRDGACGAPETGTPMLALPVSLGQASLAATSAEPTSAATTPASVFAITPAMAMATPMATAPAVISGHPRLILDNATLTALRARAAANTPQWQALKAVCDSFIGGTVDYPQEGGAAYQNLPNLGAGYEGESYLPALLSEGICYQVTKTSNPTAAAQYGAKAVDILMKMSVPYTPDPSKPCAGLGTVHGWNPNCDSGYPMRNYGVAFGLGYDWVYDLLTPAQRTQIYTTANAWIQSFETQTFEYDHPQSNYFAGYFHAKAVIALGTYGDNPQAPTEWNDWYTNQFLTRVQPYYNLHLTGGGWPEGFANYAPLGILNMTMPAREVMTATGTDIIHNTAAPYSYPLDNANYLMHFTWPSRAYFDDRDMNHSQNNPSPTNPQPGTTQVGLAQFVLGAITYWKSPQVGVFNQYLNEINAATNSFNPAVPWVAFLQTDPNAPTTPLSTLPLSYFAQGMNAVAARSDWGTGATWMSFRAGPYVNSPAQGEEYFDQGSPAFVRGGNPLLVNATGWIIHEPNGGADEDRVYNDNQGKSDGSQYMGNREIYNLFFARKLDASGKIVGDFGQRAFSVESYPNTRTKISGFEDNGDYVYALATHLEDMFSVSVTPKAVAGWSRSVLYLRPNRFVVFDRTTKGDPSYDQYEAWHFPANPVKAAAPTGQQRIDVTYNGTYMGAMTTVLPANATLTTTPMYPATTANSSPSNPVKVWQVQVRPADNGVQQNWLTVFDLSTSASAVAAATPITVTQGAMVGAQLAASDGNTIVLESTNDPDAPVSGTVSYTVPASQAHHVLVGLAKAAGYNVTAAVNGGSMVITVAPGGTFVTSVNGVLDFNVSAGGTVGAGAPPAPPPPVSSLPVAGFPVPYKS